MSTFKVGDKVRIIHYGGDYTSNPAGTVGIITASRYQYFDVDHDWPCTVDEIEHVDVQYSEVPYYSDGRKYQPFDVINDWDLSFAVGCIVKYASRLGRKTEDQIPDLKKIIGYAEMEITRLEGND